MHQKGQNGEKHGDSDASSLSSSFADGECCCSSIGCPVAEQHIREIVAKMDLRLINVTDKVDGLAKLAEKDVQLNTAQMELMKREMADREKENGELGEKNGQMKAQLDIQQKILADFEERMHGMETGMRALREENDKLLKQHQILADFEERMQGMETEMRAFREENDKWRKQHEKQRNEAELKKLKNEGKTLHSAVKNGDIGLCKRLLELGANLHEKAGMYGNTPLHCASFLNEPEICVLLLDNGARLGEKNHSGNTPLHDAYLFGCHNIVNLLIGRGADKSTKNNDGKMPREETDRYKHVPMHLRRW